ncbi:hypothetical protein RclHR1_13470009 [Rhizophagus clarus]|uniref:Uncharacterized protein n=1 Tax=Rhizophagus clarus TaxID=94130 RepID=A0A2Z6QA31_9GLOM|nr:hypothetical protein RclHR1_13470009 [Rhizophagus clarus]
MAGYPPPKFHGLAGENPADYIRDLRQWCEASPNHDPNAVIIPVLQIGAINGLANNNALRAINANQFRGGALHIRNTVPADNNAIANPLVPGHTVWEEDWSISGGRPTHLAPNAPNANAGGNVITRGMFVGQKIHTFLHDFPTVTAEKSKVKFQSLIQGNDPVGRFYANLKRMVKLAYPLLPAVNQDELVKQQFFHGLKPDNQIKVRRIGLETPLPGLIKKLEEIERYSAQQILGMTLHQPSHKTNSQGSTSAEIDKLKSEIAFLRTQLAQPVQVHPQNNEALEKMYIRAVRLGMPSDAPRDLTSLDNYINDELIRRLGVANANYAKLSKQINAVKKLHKSGRKPTRKTSKTKKKKSKNKSKKKKSKSGRVHTARVDEQSDSDSSDNDASSLESEDSSSSSESSSSESESKAEADAEINVNISRVKDAETPGPFGIPPLADPSGIASVPIFKKEKQSSKSPPQDEQSRLEKIIEKIIEKVLNEKFGTITALLHSQNDNSKILADSEEDEFIEVPIEIDFVQKKDPATDVATVKCRIKRLVIPAGTVDPGANFPIMSEDIAKRSKLEIDTKEKHDLRGIATTPTESLGIVRNVPVNFAPGCTIYADFAVVKYPKPMLILPNTLLDKYNYDLLASKRELRLECNGKEFFIPINMHKVKNKLEVNCATTIPECDDSSTPDKILQDLIKDGTFKKK